MRGAVAIAVAILVPLAACKREDRDYMSETPKTEDKGLIVMSTNAPGEGNPIGGEPKIAQEYNNNAYHISQGQQLFKWFNCAGCHFNGGGGIGPALMDDQWIYGSSMSNIAATIREGRPNGMPSFRGRIPEDQIWEIAAYVRSMSGNAPQAASAARSDSMTATPTHEKPSGGIQGGGDIPGPQNSPK